MLVNKFHIIKSDNRKVKEYYVLCVLSGSALTVQVKCTLLCDRRLHMAFHVEYSSDFVESRIQIDCSFNGKVSFNCFSMVSVV